MQTPTCVAFENLEDFPAHATATEGMVWMAITLGMHKPECMVEDMSDAGLEEEEEEEEEEDGSGDMEKNSLEEQHGDETAEIGSGGEATGDSSSATGDVTATKKTAQKPRRDRRLCKAVSSSCTTETYVGRGISDTSINEELEAKYVCNSIRVKLGLLI